MKRCETYIGLVTLLAVLTPLALATGPHPSAAATPAQGGGDSYFGYGGRWRGSQSRYAPPHRQSQQAHRASGGGRARAGLAVDKLPPGATSQQIGNRTYYYAGGSWYTATSSGGYTVVKKPEGASETEVATAPSDCELVYGGRKPYCYVDGIFYTVDPRGYAVTLPEVGVIVPYLPPRAEKVEHNGKPFLVVDGNRFRPVLSKGVVGYRVVEVAPALR